MIAAALLLTAAAAVEPTYLVERVVSVNGATTRVSVFRNGVAVLARRRPGERESVVREPLSKVELEVIAQVVDECYPELQRFGSAGGAPGPGQVELRVAPVGRDPLRIHYTVATTPSVALARLTQALNGLEATLATIRTPREDMSGWEPAPGDRVELQDGRIVTVLSVTPTPGSAVVHVQVGDGPASFFTTDDELRRQALRRVPR